jgi:glycosyltransferase involved in cell wall biosynthesis
MSLTISVIIPTYKRPKQTVSAIESVLSQTRIPEKIIVIDDGSPEESRQELIRNLTKYEVQLVLGTHCGHPGRVRNTGMQHVETTHVAFLDSDDLWLPEKLEIQQEIAHTGIRAQGSGYIRSGSGTSINLLPTPGVKPLRLQELLKANTICNSSVLIETSLLQEIGGLPTSYGVRGIEDYAAWLRVATVTNWALSDAPLVVYSDDPESSMRGTNAFTISERKLALFDFAAWLQSRGHSLPPLVRLADKASERVLMTWAARQSADGR